MKKLLASIAFVAVSAHAQTPASVYAPGLMQRDALARSIILFCDDGHGVTNQKCADFQTRRYLSQEYNAALYRANEIQHNLQAAEHRKQEVERRAKLKAMQEAAAQH